MKLVGRITRQMLEQAGITNPRLVRAMEAQSEQVEESALGLQTTATATERMNDASVLVLAPNGAFTNERVLELGEGLSGRDDGARLALSVTGVPVVSGGYRMTIATGGDAILRAPLLGTLASLEGAETMQRKTLAAPKLSGLGDYADDVAAGAGGVAVGGVYRTGSTLKVRVA